MSPGRSVSSNAGVRPGILADVSELAALGSRTFRDAFADQIPESELTKYIATAFSVSQLTSELTAPHSTFLLAESEGTLIGYARLLGDVVPASVPCRNALRLVRLYVEQNRVGKGFGAMLFRAAVDCAIAALSEAMWLRVWEHNRRAIQVYERWGFRTGGTIEFEMLGETRSDLVMWRRLT